MVNILNCKVSLFLFMNSVVNIFSFAYGLCNWRGSVMCTCDWHCNGTNIHRLFIYLHTYYIISNVFIQFAQCTYRTDYRFTPSQWETALLCNDVSHWLSASLESALYIHIYIYTHRTLSPFLFILTTNPTCNTETERLQRWLLLEYKKSGRLSTGQHSRPLEAVILMTSLFQWPAVESVHFGRVIIVCR